MNDLRVRLLACFLIMIPCLAGAQGGPRPITIDDLLALKSVGSPLLSPDGEWVAYTVRSRDMEEDKSNSQVWIVAADGGEPIPMTSIETSASNPRWTPDNKHLSKWRRSGSSYRRQNGNT